MIKIDKHGFVESNSFWKLCDNISTI